MAIYHLHVSTGSKKPPIDGKKQSQSAAAKYDYITRAPRYNTLGKPIPDIISGNMPIWADIDARNYWTAADMEERANGRLFKNIEFALPVELTREANRYLAIQLTELLTADENLPFTLAIHEDKAGNPHAHLIISERPNDGIERDAKTWFKRYNAKDPANGGTKKTESLKPESWLEATRVGWEMCANAALESAGLDVRIDHRSNEARGIDRETQVRIGYSPHSKAAREQINEQIKARNAERNRLDAEEAAIYWRLSVLEEQRRQIIVAETAKLEAAERAVAINAQQQEALHLAAHAAELTAGMTAIAEAARATAPQPEDMSNRDLITARKDLLKQIQKAHDHLRVEYIETEARKIKTEQEERIAEMLAISRQIQEHDEKRPLFWGIQDWYCKQDELLTAYRKVWATAGGEPDIYSARNGKELWLIICDTPEQLNEHGQEINHRRTDKYAAAKAAEAWTTHQQTKDFKAKLEILSEQRHPDIIKKLREIGGELQRRKHERKQVQRDEQDKRPIEQQQQKQTRNAVRGGR